MVKPSEEKALRSLRALCRGWGGDLVKVAENKYSLLNKEQGFSDAPFTSLEVGVDWANKKVFFTQEAWKDDAIGVICAVIHEMGHVFASKVDPYDSEELTFFGWEHRVAQKVGVVQAWEDSNRYYGTGMGTQGYGTGNLGEFGQLDPKQKRDFIAKSCVEGEKVGNLSPEGEPLSIR